MELLLLQINGLINLVLVPAIEFNPDGSCLQQLSYSIYIDDARKQGNLLEHEISRCLEQGASEAYLGQIVIIQSRVVCYYRANSHAGLDAVTLDNLADQLIRLDQAFSLRN